MDRDDVYTLSLCHAKVAKHPDPVAHATAMVEAFDEIEAEEAQPTEQVVAAKTVKKSK